MATPIRVNGPTPSGGDYSEALYFDNNNNLVTPEKAVRIVINEYMNDGTLINTTYASAN